MKHLGTALIAFSVPLVMPIVIRALLRNVGSTYAPGATAVDLTYGRGMKALGIVSLVLGLIMILGPLFPTLNAFLKLEPRATAAVVISGPFGALFLYLFAEMLIVRHRVDAEGITCGSIFHRPFKIGWKDVVAVDYSASMSWFTFRAADGRVGRVSLYMNGVRTLAEISLAHLDHKVFTDAGLKSMTATAAGQMVATHGRPN